MDEPINDGGQAFPHGDPTNGGDVGMSLRDYFAAQAIVAMVYKSGDRDGGWDPVSVAVGCYAIADAMLEAREPK